MRCSDFERAWNEWIDADATGGVVGMATSPGVAAQPHHSVAELERALRDHAAECPACRQVAARYQVLQRAIREWGPPPAAPAGLVERVLAESRAPAPSAWPIYGTAEPQRISRTAAGLLAAIIATAAALAIALPHLNRAMDRTRRNGPPAVLHITRIDPDRGSEARSGSRVLNNALSEATAATWDLARSASEPAARISRQVLDVATGPERNPAEPASVAGSGSVTDAISVPSLDSLAPDGAAAGAVWQEVGDRLTTGVRPLSETARHAFGFLLGTAPGKPDAPVNLPAQKGA